MKWFSRKGQVRSFAVDAAQHGPMARHAAGIRPVPVESIVGSVGRDHELRADFMPILTPHGDQRYSRIREVMEQGRSLPPVDLYKLGDRYYVVDGNHRVAVARRLGMMAIDAVITEYRPLAAA